MARDISAGAALGRMVGLAIGVAAVAAAYHVRVDKRRDPVGALRVLVVRYPQLRDGIPLDRLGPACDGGDGEACAALAKAVAESRDLVAASLPFCLEHALYVRGCDGGSWRACDMVLHDEGGCGPPDLERTRRVMQFDCDRSDFAACDALARLPRP